MPNSIMSQMMPATARAMSTSAVCAAWRRLLRRRRTPKTTNNTASSTSTPTITNVIMVVVMASSLNAPSWNRLTMTKATSATMGSVATPPKRHRMPNSFTKTGKLLPVDRRLVTLQNRCFVVRLGRFGTLVAHSDLLFSAP